MGEGPETADIADLDITIAHWHVRSWGGAEYLATKLARALDLSEIHTIGEPSTADNNPYGDVEWTDVTTGPASWLKRRFGRAGEYALWEDVDWRDYGYPDVLITSGATTRAVITPDDTLHINYCHSPPRWYYDLYHDRMDSLTGILSRPLLRYLRMRDHSIDSRVDYYFSNSPIVDRRLWKYYKRESKVLYPPVDLSKYRNNGDDGYYLHLGRLADEKGVPAVVEAFTDTNHSLVLAGGRGDVDEAVLQTINRSKNVEWRGFVSNDEKYDLIASCRAVVFNGRNEDFGIVPIEANASGKPVLTRNEGFPGLFIESGKNGLLHDGTSVGITDALERFNPTDYSSEEIRDRTTKFDSNRFEERVQEHIEDWYLNFLI